MISKLIFFISIVLFGFTQLVSAQHNVSDKMYHYFKGMDDVTYMAFSKSMMDFVDMDLDDEFGDDSNVTGDLNEVRVLIYKPEVNPNKSFCDQVLGFLKKGKYEKLEDDDKDDNTEVWVNRNGRKIYECHVIFQGERNGVLLSFFGDFNVKDVDKLERKIKEYE